LALVVKQAFKRTEFWVVVLAAATAAVWALKPPTEPPPLAAAELPVDGPQRGTIELLAVSIERDHGNARLDLLVRGRNHGMHPLDLSPPTTRLMTANGREVPPFILPGAPLPAIAPATTSEVVLSYWAEAEDLLGALNLSCNGVSLPVKDAQQLDLETLENQRRVPLTLPEER
jgi:hypothetical protein